MLTRLRRSARQPFALAVRWALRNRAVKSYALRTLANFPRLKDRLRTLAMRFGTGAAAGARADGPAGAPRYLSPGAARILARAGGRAPLAAPTAAGGGGRHPTLAYFSPLPPDRSGIADYSAELLPELAHAYDIEIIAPQAKAGATWGPGAWPVRSVAWFRANARRYERLLYHVGNSPFHSHMFDLLHEHPGVLVLHDFFLGHVQCLDEVSGTRPLAWTRELLHGHGYAAVQERLLSRNPSRLNHVYPCSLGVIQDAAGVIVHSQAACALARHWYGRGAADGWAVIPLLRAPPRHADAAAARREARRELRIGEDSFLVCSFGFLGPNKLSDRVLQAWLDSPLNEDRRCLLVFVGENETGGFGADLVTAIRTRGDPARIRITGWASAEDFRRYLQAADVAVQLRCQSRGETSSAVLDCMNHGIATIVNAHGSMAELPRDAVWMLPDACTRAELTDALVTLHRDPARRSALGGAARAAIAAHHAPASCCASYVAAIERFHAEGSAATDSVARQMDGADAAARTERAARIDAARVPRAGRRQLLLDVTGTANFDFQTGVERVARSICRHLLLRGQDELQVEPVYLSRLDGRWHYRYARNFALALLDCARVELDEPAISYHAGDIVLTLDLALRDFTQAADEGLFATLRAAGVRLHCVVHDLLPILHPQHFPPGADVPFRAWIDAVLREADGVVADSRKSAADIADYLRGGSITRPRPLAIDAFALGADLAAGVPAERLRARDERLLERLRARPSFLMVGSIEPRKAHRQVIAGFEQLWARGVEAQLVIVGREGWRNLPEAARRDIPDLVGRLRSHPQRDRRLFWLDGIDDALLERVYAASVCLIAASEDEGFGLPIVEAARHGVPVLARDIAVFREVAPPGTAYFSGADPGALAEAVGLWLQARSAGTARAAASVQVVTWKESAEQLLQVVRGQVR